jgi:ribosomal protein S12 methylthiotransferase
MVFFECDRELMSGDFVSVKITGSTEYDLMGIMEENV